MTESVTLDTVTIHGSNGFGIGDGFDAFMSSILGWANEHNIAVYYYHPGDGPGDPNAPPGIYIPLPVSVTPTNFNNIASDFNTALIFSATTSWGFITSAIMDDFKQGNVAAFDTGMQVAVGIKEQFTAP
ncbi:hypothetical protein [Paracoccus aminovorans]|uniref:hypothetical protein n=1 Tax=Paracoccus aminovorans TaxID=34004 RepID=UPI00111463D8|nr:hypothetical protein [Paracoccus aminovorans]